MHQVAETDVIRLALSMVHLFGFTEFWLLAGAVLLWIPVLCVMMRGKWLSRRY